MTRFLTRSIAGFPILILILTSAPARISWAENENYRSPISALECPEVDLEPAFQDSSEIPLSDRKSEVMSDSIEAVQLLDFYKKGNQASSPLILAIESQASATPSLENSILIAQKHGTCPDTVSLQKGLDQVLQERPERFLTALHQALLKNPDEFDLDQIFSLHAEENAEADCKTCKTQSPLESNAIQLILDAVPGADSKKAILKVLEATAHLCPPSKRNLWKGILEPVVKPVHNTAQLYGIIQDRWGSGAPARKQPIALSICKSILEKGRNYSGVDPARLDNSTQGTHCSLSTDAMAISLYGSRRDRATGRCEVKVRSPWGPGQQVKQSGLECKSYSPEWPCKNGAIWLDLEALGRNSVQAVYLDPR